MQLRIILAWAKSKLQLSSVKSVEILVSIEREKVITWKWNLATSFLQQYELDISSRIEGKAAHEACAATSCF